MIMDLSVISFLKILGFIPLEIQIFENLWCVAANYENDVTVMRNRAISIFGS